MAEFILALTVGYGQNRPHLSATAIIVLEITLFFAAAEILLALLVGSGQKYLFLLSAAEIVSLLRLWPKLFLPSLLFGRTLYPPVAAQIVVVMLSPPATAEIILPFPLAATEVVPRLRPRPKLSRDRNRHCPPPSAVAFRPSLRSNVSVQPWQKSWHPLEQRQNCRRPPPS